MTTIELIETDFFQFINYLGTLFCQEEEAENAFCTIGFSRLRFL